MKDPTKLKELILEKVDLASVMTGYGIQFTFNPAYADEVQYRCQFHGKGDNKPSARFYRQTKSCYCWVCRKRWNVIEFIKDKEVLNYYQALKYIASKYKLDLSSIPDDPEFVENKKELPSETILQLACMHKALLRMRGKLDFERYNVLCAYFLSTSYRDHEHEDVRESLSKLEEKLLKAEKSCLVS